MANIAKNRSRASRYARALFDVAVAEGDPRAVEGGLAGFVALLDAFPLLRRVLWNPAVPTARKLSAVGEIVRRAGYPAPLAKMLTLLAGRDLLSLLPEVLDAYRRRLMDHEGIVAAHVTTAVPLAEDRLRAVAAALGRATGKRVTMTTRVDPAIIGGVVAKVDSTVYDGSVARQLERIREKMAGGA
jgi:F-type H+-transporting ATPase subunit delta